jgi:hypothetical protein
MLTKAFIFLRSNVFPSLEIMNPKIVPEHTINAHLVRIKLIPNSLHFRKHFLSFLNEWISH